MSKTVCENHVGCPSLQLPQTTPLKLSPDGEGLDPPKVGQEAAAECQVGSCRNDSCGDIRSEHDVIDVLIHELNLKDSLSFRSQ